MDLAKADRTIDRLRALLSAMSEGMNREDAEIAVRKLVAGFKKLDTISDISYFSLVDPSEALSDAREKYVYVPTRLACAIVMRAVLDHKELLEDRAVGESLYFGLNGCVGNHFFGQGFDREEGFFDTMEIFSQADILCFIARYPTFNEKFANEIDEAMRYLKQDLCSGRVTDPWNGETYAERAERLLGSLTRGAGETADLLFVYGTLMRGQRAHPLLSGCEYRGRYVLKGYGMFDLGAFPGIVERNGECVVGEVYSIAPEQIPAMDRYEGEGSLYDRTIVTVSNDCESIRAYAYVYARTPDESGLMRTMWDAKPDDEVWYACYGSNLSEKRFNCYIEGGRCEENGICYPGCEDKTRWSEKAFMSFRGALYFGNESGSWRGKGVAFYDPGAEGVIFMRLYKLKYAQLMDVRRMEGASPEWYGRIVCLGVKDDVPIYTLTSETRRPANAPCGEYIRLIVNAMKNELRLSSETILDTVIRALTTN